MSRVAAGTGLRVTADAAAPSIGVDESGGVLAGRSVAVSCGIGVGGAHPAGRSETAPALRRGRGY
jgi:hypothetical protein